MPNVRLPKPTTRKIRPSPGRCQCGAALVTKRAASHWSGIASSSSATSLEAPSSLFFYPSFFSTLISATHASTSHLTRPAQPKRPRSSRFSILNSPRLPLPRSAPPLPSSFSHVTRQSYAIASSSSSSAAASHSLSTSSVSLQQDVDSQQIPLYTPPPYESQSVRRSDQLLHVSPGNTDKGKGKARQENPGQAEEEDILETEGVQQELSTGSTVDSRPASRRELKTLHSIRTEQQEYAKAGHLDWARFRWYKFVKRFHPHTFNSANNWEARKVANLTLAQLVALHVPTSESEKIQGLITHFEETADTTNMAISPYNSLLKTYAQKLDVPRAFETFIRMKELSVTIPTLRPVERSYSHLITMFAHLRDPESAQKLFDEMLRSDIQPTQASYTSLMNAHVEAGHWDHAIVMFDFLDSHPEGHLLKPDISTCTTLLKTYVLMGAPVSEVLKVYAGIVDRNLRPTSRTFALLLQSACDAGMTDFAEEIFAKMDSRVPDPAHTRKDEGSLGALANVYTFTVMIRGLLRAGKQDEAKQYYDEMVSRGIEPSSATWSTLIGAYAQAQVTDENAERIVQNLLDEYLKIYSQDSEGVVHQSRPKEYEKDKPLARGTALHSVYGPVITAYGQMAAVSASLSQSLSAPAVSEEENDSFDAVETSPANMDSKQAAVKALEKYRDMLTLPGAKPSIHIYTALLDAYRRANDMQGLQQIWDALFEFALSSTKIDYVDGLISAPTSRKEDVPNNLPHINPSRRNILCFPLSIYIDALSSNHLHGQIADIWMRVQQEGFGFDAGNWNHLAVALVRAGELDRAFWTVQTVLLQESEESGSVPGLQMTPMVVEESEVTDVVQSDHVDQVRTAKAETPIRPPNRSHEHHVGEKENLYRTGAKMRLPEKRAPPRLRHLPLEERQDDGQEIEIEANEEMGGRVSKEVSTDLTDKEGNKAIRIPLRSMPSAGRSRSELTGSYASIRQKRHGEIWTAYASTLRVLEDALIRLDQATDTPNVEDDEVRTIEIALRREEASRQIEHLESSYPATMEAIEKYRRKMNSLISRA